MPDKNFLDKNSSNINSATTSETFRLQHYLAKCGVGSRRSNEKLILDGRVTVNGQVVSTLGTKVSVDDDVRVDGEKAVFESKTRYVLLNKPAGYVCSLSDEKGRMTASDIVKEYYPERLYNVGRLDMYSSGLIIFTNDGEFAKCLMHPSSQIEKEYVVETSTDIDEDLIKRFKKGVRVEGVFYRCQDAKLLNSRKVQVVLIEGKNREIRKVFESYGLGIKSLERVRIGNITIDGLQTGECRELSLREVEELKKLFATYGG